MKRYSWWSRYINNYYFNICTERMPTILYYTIRFDMPLWYDTICHYNTSSENTCFFQCLRFIDCALQSGTYYTVGHKKCHFIWDHNSHVSWWIFILLAPVETGKNTLSGNCKICNFTTIVSLHYLRKFENTHNSTFWNQLSVYFNAQRHQRQRQERVQVNCFLECVLKMSTLFSHKGCQTLSLVDIIANDLLLDFNSDG